MSLLAAYEPKKVFAFFEELCAIPHGSGNVRRISDWCAAFARERGLWVLQDSLYNVIIKKPGTAGYAEAEPVILQGHLDMVCAKETDCPKNMEQEGVTLRPDGDWIRAAGTSLGGDNGIGIALILAVLDADDLAHPPIEAVFTVDEETGMEGAQGLDFSVLSGRRMLNLDSEEEGVFTVSCAGGARVDCVLPAGRTEIPAGSVLYGVTVSGLQGGHSGVDIDKGRGSSNQLIGRFLYEAFSEGAFGLCALAGGKLDNVIPGETEATVAVPAERAERFCALAAEYDAIYRDEYRTADPGVRLTVREIGREAAEIAPNGMLTEADTEKVLLTLLTVPYHVQAMSAELPGLVQTSLNMGILLLTENELQCIFAVRSSLESQKKMLIARLKAIFTHFGGSAQVRSAYPGWAYRQDSPLRTLLENVYEEQCGKKPQITATHGGLECGLFCDKLLGLDCVSLGPELLEVHSVRERLSASSTERLWQLLCAALRRMA